MEALQAEAIPTESSAPSGRRLSPRELIWAVWAVLMLVLVGFVAMQAHDQDRQARRLVCITEAEAHAIQAYDLVQGVNRCVGK